MSVPDLSLLTPDISLATDQRFLLARATDSHPLRVAIVGCGAVAQYIHLPALLASTQLRVTALVDPDPARRHALGARLGMQVHTAAGLADIERYADLAIVAVPNHLHVPLASDLLQRGLHVFLEKPMALSFQQASDLIDVARRSGRALGVGVIRRQYPSFDFVRHVLHAGWLGPIESFDFREGVISNWPAASLSPYRREHGGGVLLDVGAHALDMLLGWLGPFARVHYRDDARGGVEANCLLELELHSGARGVVELSRTRYLRNTCILRGKRGEMEVGITPDSPVTLRLGRFALSAPPCDERADTMDICTAARNQLHNFARSAHTSHDTTPIPAAELLEPFRLFDACREKRAKLDLPWEPFAADIDWSQFAGKRVLVLGGAGFIGARVVAALAQNSGARLRVLARQQSRLESVARYPIEIVRGDVSDRATLEQAMQQCDYVINCTYGKGDRGEQVRVNIDAVRTLVQLAHACAVRQIVHLSTMLVYGTVRAGVLDERMRARAPRGEIYGYTKWRGEEVALSEAKRLGVRLAVLQPTAVYGPGAPSWTLNPLRTLKHARIVLVNGGTGISNAVYVDDVVTAILNGLLTPEAAGERMLISGPDAVTWREFYGAYDALLGGGRTVDMDRAAIAYARRAEKKRHGNLTQLRALLREEEYARRRLLALPALRAAKSVARRVMPKAMMHRLQHRITAPASPRAPHTNQADPIRLPSTWEEDFFGAAAAVSCTKAATLIRYAPRYSFSEGMRLTGAWAEWARLL